MAGTLAIDKMKSMGKSAEKMSALEVAAMGKTMASGNRGVNLEMDAADPDWQRVVARAKSDGPGSWFASKVDFMLNGAHFTGKVGYSVKGGVVPLFDGAALDLGTAGLEAENPKKAAASPQMGSPSAYKNWVIGSGGLLVLAPVGMDNVVPVTTEQVIITEKGLAFEAHKSVSFHSGDKVVQADRMEISDRVGVLYGVHVQENGTDESDKYRSEALLNGSGISLVPNPDYVAPSPQNEAAQEGTSGGEGTQEPAPAADAAGTGGTTETPGAGETTETPGAQETVAAVDTPEEIMEPADQGIAAPENNPIAEAVDHVSTSIIETITPETQLSFGSAKEDPEAEDPEAQRTGVGLMIDTQSKSVHLGYNSETSEPEEESPLWEQIAEALKTKATDEAKELLKKAVKEKDLNKFKENFLNLAAEEWGQLKAIYDGFSSEELKESWKLFPGAVKDYFRGRMNDKDATEYMKKLIPTGPISEFLGMNDKEEEEGDTKAEDGGIIPLTMIPIFPGLLDFTVDLTPGYSFSTFVLGDARNMKALWDVKEEEAAELEFSAGIRGSLSLKAGARINVGPSVLFQGYGELYAKAALEGNKTEPMGATRTFGAGGENVALAASGKLPIKRMQDGSVKQADKVQVSLDGGLSLKGSVGVDVGIRSAILMWQKTLWEKTLAEWDLLSIKAHLGAEKEVTSSPFSGWKLNDAFISVGGGFKDAFLENNTAERRYGLYNPEPVDASGYKDIEQNFRGVLKLLTDFKDSQSGGPALAIATGEGSGFSSTLGNMTEQLGAIQNQAVAVWVEAQNELQVMEENLAERSQSTGLKKQYLSAMKASQKHADRIAYMGNWQESSGQNALDYYRGHSSKAGSQFIKQRYEESVDSLKTYEAIVAYERERYGEKTKKHFDRIAEVKRMQAAGAAAEEIREKYSEISGGRVKKHQSLVQNTGTLRGFEEQRYLDVTKDARERQSEVLKLTRKFSDNREQFFKTYGKKYADSETTDNEIFSIGDAQILLNYEEAKYQGIKNKSTLEMLNEARAQKTLADGSQDPAKKDEASAHLRAQMAAKDKKKGATLTEMFGNEIYRTATIDDILEVEMEEYIKGDAGKFLTEYMNQPGAKLTGERVSGDRTKIFKENSVKTEAYARFGSFLDKSQIADLIPYMTVEILLEYARLRRAKATKDYEKKTITKEINFLTAGLALMDTAAPGEARNVEMGYIAKYFEQFSGVEDQYREDLKGGNVLNLKMMYAGLTDGQDNPVYTQLLEMKEKGVPDYEAMRFYLEARKERLKIKQPSIVHLNEHQKKKAETTPMGYEDVFRFYENRTAEESAVNQDGAGHYARYAQLKQMADENKSYDEMLEAYVGMGAGQGYRDYLIAGITAGKIGTKELTYEDIVTLEQRRVERFGEKHRTRLEMINQGIDEGRDYQSINAEYENKTQTDNQGISGMKKRIFHTKSRYEKAMNKQELSPEQLITYEELRADEVGKKHADRLRSLLNLDASGDVMTASLIPDLDEREAKRQDYLSKSKRFKKQKSEGDEGRKAFEQQLMAMPGEEIRQNIIDYETGRKQSYDDELSQLENSEKEIREMRDNLDQMVQTCHALTNTMINIKDNPDHIFDELARFESTVNFLDAYKNASALNEAERAVQEAADQGNAAAAQIAQAEEEEP